MNKLIKIIRKFTVIIVFVLLLLYTYISTILIDTYDFIGELISLILFLLIPIFILDFSNKNMQKEINFLMIEIKKKNMTIAELRFEKLKKKKIL